MICFFDSQCEGSTALVHILHDKMNQTGLTWAVGLFAMSFVSAVGRKHFLSSEIQLHIKVIAPTFLAANFGNPTLYELPVSGIPEIRYKSCSVVTDGFLLYI